VPVIDTADVTSCCIQILFKMLSDAFNEIAFNEVEFLLIEMGSRTFI